MYIDWYIHNLNQCRVCVEATLQGKVTAHKGYLTEKQADLINHLLVSKVDEKTRANNNQCLKDMYYSKFSGQLRPLLLLAAPEFCRIHKIDKD